MTSTLPPSPITKALAFWAQDKKESKLLALAAVCKCNFSEKTMPKSERKVIQIAVEMHSTLNSTVYAQMGFKKEEVLARAFEIFETRIATPKVTK